MKTKVYLFVYGELKRNSSAHKLIKHCKFIDTAVWNGHLYKVNEEYPGAVLSGNIIDEVHGELYLVKDSETTLTILDNYEECSETGLFKRFESVVMTNKQNKIIRTWIYIYNRPVNNMRRILSGTWNKNMKTKIEIIIDRGREFLENIYPELKVIKPIMYYRGFIHDGDLYIVIEQTRYLAILAMKKINGLKLNFNMRILV